jgi:hypothetical protein
VKKKKPKIRNSPEDKAPGRRDIFGGTLLAVSAIILSLSLAYGNSLNGAFIFDDLPNIVNNPTIRNLSNLQDIFCPPSTPA